MITGPLVDEAMPLRVDVFGGQSRTSATSEAFKALLERSKAREPELARSETSDRFATLLERSATKPTLEPEAAQPEPGREASAKLQVMLERQERDKAERDARGEAAPSLPLLGTHREDKRDEKAKNKREKLLSAAQQRRQDREQGRDRDDGLDR